MLTLPPSNLHPSLFRYRTLFLPLWFKHYFEGVSALPRTPLWTMKLAYYCKLKLRICSVSQTQTHIVLVGTVSWFLDCSTDLSLTWACGWSKLNMLKILSVFLFLSQSLSPYFCQPYHKEAFPLSLRNMWIMCVGCDETDIKTCLWFVSLNCTHYNTFANTQTLALLCCVCAQLFISSTSR